jgi:Spy/CpxP family protein refolding chaperone
MKKFLLPLLALALSATAASAQTTPDQAGHPQRTPEEMAARQTQGLTRQLGLSADQSAKVQQILLARDQEMLAMRSQMQAGTADRQQLRQQMMAGRTKYDDQLKAVLTPDQYAKMQTMQANRRQRGGMQMPEDGKVKAKDGKLKIKAKTDD